MSEAGGTVSYWRELAQKVTPREGTRMVVERFRFPAGFWGSKRGRAVHYLTDAEMPAYIAETDRSSREWGCRTTVRVDGRHYATLGEVPGQSRRARRSRAGR